MRYRCRRRGALAAPAGGLCDIPVAAGGCPDVTASSCSGRWGDASEPFLGMPRLQGTGWGRYHSPMFSEMRCHQGALHHLTAFLRPPGPYASPESGTTRSAGKRPFVRPKPPSYIPEGRGGT